MHYHVVPHAIIRTIYQSLAPAVAGPLLVTQRQYCGGGQVLICFAVLPRGPAWPRSKSRSYDRISWTYPIEPTRVASVFLVYHTARAASGRLVPTRIRASAIAAVREATNLQVSRSLLDLTCEIL